MISNSYLRKKIKDYLSSIKKSDDIYGLFKLLNYPKKAIFDPSYVTKIKEFSFASEERDKIKSIYTVMSYDKLNVFLIECNSLAKPLSGRAELDNIIFDELGLTKEERKEVYWAVCELVQQRLSKATSLNKK